MPLRLIAVLLLMMSPRAHALDVRSTLWGFDGTVVPGRVNLLSVLVANPGPTPIEGTLRLQRGLLVPEGPSLTSSFFLAPGAARWVQLHPWVTSGDRFKLLWGREAFELPEPRSAAPAAVLLADPEAVSSAVARFRTFPDELFPSTVAATDALATVVLDHAPHWQPVQRQAFRDWLARGGHLHLLQGPSGERWSFGGDLAELDRAEERFGYGGGRVQRHDGTRRDVGPEQAGVVPAPAPEQGSVERRMGARTMISSVRTLAASVRPQHDWGLIYAILGVLLACVGPLPWLIARRGVDARWINLGMIVAVVLATWSLAVAGRRGYGEKATVYTLAYARSLGADADGTAAWDVRQWANAFVTASDTYVFAHRGAPNFYAIPGDDPVEAQISETAGGSLAARIPLYSSITFLHHARLTGPTIAAEIVRADQHWQGGAGHTLELHLGKRPPGKLRVARLLYRGRLYDLRSSSPDSFVTGDASQQLANLRDNLSGYGDGWYEYTDADTALSQRSELLVAEAATEDPPPTDDPATACLYLYADLPAEFQTTGEGFAQQGRVLYRVDLMLPSSATGPVPAPPTPTDE